MKKIFPVFEKAYREITWLPTSKTEAIYIPLYPNENKIIDENGFFSFLKSLFLYNFEEMPESLELAIQSFIQEKENDFVLSGGLCFSEDEIKISPSCCCGLESVLEIIESIEKRNEVWLGHSPYPVFEYQEDKVILWSDDCLGIWEEKIDKSTLQSISYTYQELSDLLSKAKDEYIQFLTVDLKEYMQKTLPEYVDDFLICFEDWLST